MSILMLMLSMLSMIGSDDTSCRVFDIRACAQVVEFKNENVLCGITSVSFSRSGRVLFAGYDDYNCLGWDVLGKSWWWW